jgi:hypothetical protein
MHRRIIITLLKVPLNMKNMSTKSFLEEKQSDMALK